MTLYVELYFVFDTKYINLEMLVMSGDDAVHVSVSGPVSVRSSQSVAAGEIAARSNNSRSPGICSVMRFFCDCCCTTIISQRGDGQFRGK